MPQPSLHCHACAASTCLLCTGAQAQQSVVVTANRQAVAVDHGQPTGCTGAFGPPDDVDLAQAPHPQVTTEQIRLPVGARLYESGSLDGPGWQLLSGALRLDQGGFGRESLVQLALPGDLVGLEPLYGLPRRACATALVDCCLQKLHAPDARNTAAMSDMLAIALNQQWHRAADMAGLRTGSAPDRVKRLLLLLHGDARSADVPGNPPATHALPRIKDIAALVDSAHETVSRILTGLRRLDVLQERHPCSASFNRQTLDDCQLPKGMTRSVPWLRTPGKAQPSAKA